MHTRCHIPFHLVVHHHQPNLVGGHGGLLHFGVVLKVADDERPVLELFLEEALLQEVVWLQGGPLCI